MSVKVSECQLVDVEYLQDFNRWVRFPTVQRICQQLPMFLQLLKAIQSICFFQEESQIKKQMKPHHATLLHTHQHIKYKLPICRVS